MSKKDCRGKIRLYHNAGLDYVEENSIVSKEEDIFKIKQFLDSFIESDRDQVSLGEMDEDSHKVPWKKIGPVFKDIMYRFAEGGGYFKYKDSYFSYNPLFDPTIKKIDIDQHMEHRKNRLKEYDQYPNLSESQVIVENAIFGVRDLNKILSPKWIKKYTDKYKELYEKILDIELEKQDEIYISDTLLPTDNCLKN